MLTIGDAVPSVTSALFTSRLLSFRSQGTEVLAFDHDGHVFLFGKRSRSLITDVLAWRSPPLA